MGTCVFDKKEPKPGTCNLTHNTLQAFQVWGFRVPTRGRTDCFYSTPPPRLGHANPDMGVSEIRQTGALHTERVLKHLA